MEIRRNAEVEAADGIVGRLSHVIVDPETRRITRLVVKDAGYEWLVDARDVVASGARIRLYGSREQYYREPFDQRAFRAPRSRRHFGESLRAKVRSALLALRYPPEFRHTNSSAGQAALAERTAKPRLLPAERIIIERRPVESAPPDAEPIAERQIEIPVLGMAPLPASAPSRPVAATSARQPSPGVAPSPHTPAYLPEGPVPVEPAFYSRDAIRAARAHHRAVAGRS